MNSQVHEVLAELEAFGREHDANQNVHARKMLNLEADTAQLISILIQSGRRTSILEIGTSNGYSTIWLAASTLPLGGHVTSIEHNSEKLAMAEQNLSKAGVREAVTFLQGDAVELVEGLEGTYDLVFLDANRHQYTKLLPHVLRKLKPDALLLADNVHSHPQEIADYLDAINSNADFSHVVIGVGKGLSVAFRQG